MNDTNREISTSPIEWINGYGKSWWQPVCGDVRRWWVVGYEGQGGYLWGRKNRYEHAQVDKRSRRAAIRIGRREQRRRTHVALGDLTEEER